MYLNIIPETLATIRFVHICTPYFVRFIYITWRWSHSAQATDRGSLSWTPISLILHSLLDLTWNLKEVLADLRMG